MSSKSSSSVSYLAAGLRCTLRLLKTMVTYLVLGPVKRCRRIFRKEIKATAFVESSSGITSFLMP